MTVHNSRRVVDPSTGRVTEENPVETPVEAPPARTEGVGVTTPRPLGEVRGAEITPPQAALVGRPEATKVTNAERNAAAVFATSLAQVAGTVFMVDDPAAVPVHASALLEGKAFRLAIGGYFKPPSTAHDQRSYDYLQRVIQALGADDTLLVTSPSTTRFEDGSRSIDRISTDVGAATGAKTFYVTAVGYVGKIKSGDLNQSARPTYEEGRKYVLPTDEAYAWAAMKSSNALVITGGRNASVSDFVKTIKLGHRAVLAANTDLGPLRFENQTPSDAARYLSTMLARAYELAAAGRDVGDPAGYPFGFMPNRGFDGDFLRAHVGRMSTLVCAVELGGGADVAPAVEATRKHLAPLVERGV